MAEQMRPQQAQTPDERARATAMDMAQAEADARARKADEAPAGGRYMVGDQLVNAEGEPVKDERKG